MKSLFLNDKFIFSVIIVNAVSIFLQESNFATSVMAWVDFICSVIFLVEMIVKLSTLGVGGYWRDGWNKMDCLLVLFSIPSIIMFVVPVSFVDLSVLLALRLFRVLRVFRLMHFFPGFSKIVDGFVMAMRKSYAVLLSFFVIIVIFGLINCSLFRDLAPDFFGTPISSIYSVFRLCTIEGWYEIPDAISNSSSPVVGSFVSVYFCFLLIMGGIIGMSFINSIFVDAMVEDNNDDVKEQIAALDAKIDELKELLAKKDSQA